MAVLFNWPGSNLYLGESLRQRRDGVKSREVKRGREVEEVRVEEKEAGRALKVGGREWFHMLHRTVQQYSMSVSHTLFKQGDCWQTEQSQGFYLLCV